MHTSSKMATFSFPENPLERHVVIDYFNHGSKRLTEKDIDYEIATLRSLKCSIVKRANKAYGKRSLFKVLKDFF